MEYAGLWIFFCFLVAFAGKEKKIGYWGTFFLSLLLSPLIGLIIALVSSKKNEIYKVKCRYCGSVNYSNFVFCNGCGKNRESLTREDFEKRSNDPEYQKDLREKELSAKAAEEARLKKRRRNHQIVLLSLVAAVIILIVVAILLNKSING